MAVEAHRLNPIFSPNREILNSAEANGLLYSDQMRYVDIPYLVETAPFHPMYNIAAPSTVPPATDYMTHHTMKPAIQSGDSSVTFNGDCMKNNDLLPASSSLRKRSREASVIVNPPTMPPSSSYLDRQKPCNDPLVFLGNDLSLNIQQQQLDVDRLLSNHINRMRVEIEMKRKRQARRIMEFIEHGLVKRLRARDEEIEKIAKLNLYLEEKVKSLCVENQIWRDLAQSNEATANALRTNLQQVIATVERSRCDETTALVDDAQSCCGSSSEGEVGEEEAPDRKRVRRIAGRKRVCRSCGEGEACVLLLPCRHLCLCTLCGSSLNTCPVCKYPKNASVHLNLSC